MRPLGDGAALPDGPAPRRTVVGITGATGVAFTLRLLERLKGETYAIPTRWGLRLLADEASLTPEDLAGRVTRVFQDSDLSAPVSSGSTRFDAMVILPCSAGTLNKISLGLADTLLTRCALVALKERRRLVLCLRETPLSTQTLRNAARLSADGAVIMPIMPPYYLRPLTMEAVLDSYASRVLQVLGQGQGDLWKGSGMEPPLSEDLED